MSETLRAYPRYVTTVASHTLDMLPRRRISFFAAFLAFVPLAIPVMLLLSRELAHDPNGEQVFIRIVQFMYISALAPLLALFYGSTLIGEDVESNTLPYILTRPIPRTAWVLGKFVGYTIGVSALLGGSMLLVFLACTRLSNFPLDAAALRLFGGFFAALVMAIGAYGALSLLFGALFKRPIIWGVAFVFFWQRIALTLPGYVDFLTIEKYVSAIMPEVEGMQSLLQMAAQALGVGKLIAEVGPATSYLVLCGMMIAFIALTAYVVRQREYTSAVAADT